jgi:hypothetical protein
MTEDRARRIMRISAHEAGHCVAARLLRLPNCGGASVVEPHAGAVFAADHGAASICALLAGGVCFVVSVDAGGLKEAQPVGGIIPIA